jgi:hypothetical protein
MNEILNGVIPDGDTIFGGLEVLGIAFIFFCCLVIALSVETGRRNDSIRESQILETRSAFDHKTSKSAGPLIVADLSASSEPVQIDQQNAPTQISDNDQPAVKAAK